jgi:AmmeMemoRadiSam system protein B
MEKLRKIALILCLGVSPLGPSPLFAGETQEPVVAGAFYPADKATLKKMVDEYIELANPEPIEGDIVALIAPHAGYIYSGPVAGYAFKLIKDKPYKTAIIIAPSHHSAFNGLSILDKDSYITPLGEVSIDKEITGKLLAFDKRIRYNPEAFRNEHAAEVEIPFLQESL